MLRWVTCFVYFIFRCPWLLFRAVLVFCCCRGVWGRGGDCIVEHNNCERKNHATLDYSQETKYHHSVMCAAGILSRKTTKRSLGPLSYWVWKKVSLPFIVVLLFSRVHNWAKSSAAWLLHSICLRLLHLFHPRPVGTDSWLMASPSGGWQDVTSFFSYFFENNFC